MAFDEASARAAVVAFFAPPNVAGLNTVYDTFRGRVPDRDYFAGVAAGTATGAVAFVHLRGDHEQRVTVGGTTSGRKRTTRQMELALLLKVKALRSGLVAESVGVHAFDLLVAAVKARLRYDRSLGTGSARGAGDGDVWEAGNTIDTTYDDPHQVAQGGWEFAASLVFDLTQFIDNA